MDPSLVKDLLEQNRKMQAQMERLLKEKKENDKLVSRLDSMEKLHQESAETQAENEKLQEQVQQLLQEKKNAAAATGAAAASATGAAVASATGAAAAAAAATGTAHAAYQHAGAWPRPWSWTW